MTLLTKDEARSLTQQFMDDPAGKLWSADNLDILLEGVLDELWSTELLEHAPWLRSTESAALTPVVPGTVNLATALTRWHRLQLVVRDGCTYTEASPKDVLVQNGVTITAPDRTYVVMGDLLYLFPLALTANVYIRYSSLPTAFTSLADTDDVTWPDGFHLAYVYDAAARAMEKGDREESARLAKRAETSLYRLKSKLRKTGLGAIMPWHQGGGIEFGSET